MIFAFDPFAGYFSGTLYDTVIDAGTPLLTYRLGSLCTLVALALVASVLVRDERGALRVADVRASVSARTRLALGLVAASASAALTSKGPSSGTGRRPRPSSAPQGASGRDHAATSCIRTASARIKSRSS